MATYAEISSEFDYYSKKASDSVKTNALAGVGAVWVVSQTNSDKSTALFAHPRWFAISAFIFILALAFDLLHGFATSVIYWFWLNQIDDEYRDRVEERGKASWEFPTRVTRTPWWFYWLKCVAILVGTIAFGFSVILTLRP